MQSTEIWGGGHLDNQITIVICECILWHHKHRYRFLHARKLPQLQTRVPVWFLKLKLNDLNSSSMLWGKCFVLVLMNLRCNSSSRKGRIQRMNSQSTILEKAWNDCHRKLRSRYYYYKFHSCWASKSSFSISPRLERSLMETVVPLILQGLCFFLWTLFRRETFDWVGSQPASTFKLNELPYSSMLLEFYN